MAEFLKKFKKTNVSEALSIPQRIVFEQLAKAAGVKPGKTSEESAFNIVDKVANKIGIPQDSVVGNVAKSLAVGGLETFGDPTGALGKIGKVAKVANIIKPSNMRAGELVKEAGLTTGQKIIQRIPKSKSEVINTISRQPLTSKEEFIKKIDKIRNRK